MTQSVTGVGLGSADGGNHGRVGNSLSVSRLIGPRIVAAGTHTMASADGSVVLPLLPGVVGDYIVLATDSDTSGATAVTASLAFSASASTITLKGTSGNVIAYAIVKVGLAL